jgi:hypothetical protein
MATRNIHRIFESRSAKGYFKPIVFLLLEILLFAIIISIVRFFYFAPFTAMTAFVLVLYFARSSLPRYLRAVDRLPDKFII